MILIAAVICDVLYLFGQEKFIFIRENSRESQGILKSYACGKHELVLTIQ